METIVIGILVAYLENGQSKVLFYYRANKNKNKIRMQVRQKLKSEFQLLKNHLKLKKPYIFLLEEDANKYCTILRLKIRGKESFSVGFGANGDISKKDAELFLLNKLKVDVLPVIGLEVLIKNGKILSRKEYAGLQKNVQQSNLIK